MATPKPPETGTTRGLHLYGLDSIRFLSALIVVFTHTGFPIPESVLDSLGLLGKLIGAFLSNLWNGQGAVMVFFVVSGLCIHLPQVGRGAPNWPAFLIRRYLRLGVPLAAAYALGPLLHTQLFGGVNPVKSIWWSLIAELLYYTVYPALFLAVRRWGWTRVIFASLIVSVILLATHSQVLHPAKFGRLTTALIYLPVWLLGCQLAEQVGRQSLPDGIGLQRWAWRAAMVGTLVVSNALIYHAPAALPPVRFPMSVLGVGVVAWLWLPRELAWCRAHPPARWLEWCGAWSYSLYLTHLVWFDVWKRLFEGKHLPGLGTPIEFFPRTAFVLGLTVGFYFLVEGPSHRLARNAGQWIDRHFRERSKSDQPSGTAA